MWIESPLIDEILAEHAQKLLILIVRHRFGEPPLEVAKRLRAISDLEALDALHDFAVVCPDLVAFRNRLYQPFQGGRWIL